MTESLEISETHLRTQKRLLRRCRQCGDPCVGQRCMTCYTSQKRRSLSKTKKKWEGKVINYGNFRKVSKREGQGQ